jgi:uncharacterized hydrophobic protein (TIGR00271 family)
MKNHQSGERSRETDGSDGQLTALGDLIRRIRAPEGWTEQERQEVLDSLFFEGLEWIPYLKRFFALIALSTGIAAFGLIADSTAVVIGAMLVAPLMTPMLAISAATVYGRTDRIFASAMVVTLGSILAILVGALVATITPGTLTATDLSGQILARSSPGLLDLGIAVVAGLAAGYVLAHRRVGASLPGVAIAVALVPPLATAGITIRLGAVEEAQGAILLFLTNLIAIVLSAAVVMLSSGFVPRHIRAVAKGHLTRGSLIALVALAAIAVPLGFHTVEQVRLQQVQRLAIELIPEWDEGARVRRVDVGEDDGRVHIFIAVSTTGQRQPAWRLAELVATRLNHGVDLDVNYLVESADSASTG